MDIKIKAKLNAYTKGIIPTKVSDLFNDLEFISDVKNDGNVYIRRYGEWVEANNALKNEVIRVAGNSGLNLVYNPEDNSYTLSIRKEDLTQTEFEQLTQLEPDTTYYVAEQTPNTFDDGGTAFSDGNNEFIDFNEFTDIVDGGDRNSIANIIMNPLNSEGVYNG